MTSDPQEIRLRLRAYVRDHHPDRGGDPDAFAIGLAELQAELARATTPEPRPRVTVKPAAGPLDSLRGALRRRRRPPRVR